jgi:hypothetical protein
MRTVVSASLFLTFVLFACGKQTPSGQQAWIISPADGVTRTHCVELNTAGMTALDALKATGETLEILEDPALGTAVCMIGDTGWPTSTCFGTGASDSSWLYFLFDPETGTWKAPGLTEGDPDVPSSLNAFEVRDRDVLAFVFTPYDASFNPIRQPPAVTFDEVCPGK